jgi:L-aminopeptidase/D-esterase-like protein
MKGGLGCAHANYGEFLVSAIVAVNAVGDVLDEKGSVLAGAISKSGKWLAGHDSIRVVNRSKVLPHMNTTLAVLLTNARLTKVEANRMAQRGHDGLARAIDPVHTSFDGDLVFALSAGTSNGNFDLVAEMGTQAIAEAVRSAVRSASSLGGVPAAGDLRPS